MDAQVYFFNYCNQMDLNQSSMAACAPLICNSLSILTKFGVCDVYAFFVNWGRLTGKIAFYSSIAACAPPIRI